MILTKLRFGCAILDWTECLCANKRPDRQNYRNYPFVINHISLQAYNHNLHPCKSEQKIVLISARLKSPKPWGEIEGQKELALHWSLGWNRWFRGISPEIGQPGSSYCPLWTSNRLFVLQDCLKWAYSKNWEKMQQQFVWGCMVFSWKQRRAWCLLKATRWALEGHHCMHWWETRRTEITITPACKIIVSSDGSSLRYSVPLFEFSLSPLMQLMLL